MVVRALLSMLLLALASCASKDAQPPAPAGIGAADPWMRPAAVPFPADNAPNAARVALGRDLFFDTRLSGSSMISCATCHNPALGWSDGQPTAVGDGAKRLGLLVVDERERGLEP